MVLNRSPEAIEDRIEAQKSVSDG